MAVTEFHTEGQTTMAKPKNHAHKDAPAETTNAPVVNMELLKRIHEATLADGFVYVSKDEGEILLALELIVVNMEVHDAHGKVAAKTTEIGANYLGHAGDTPTPQTPEVDAEAVQPASEAASEAATEAVADAPKSAFEIKSGFTVPEVTKRGGPPSVYPFEQLEVGQYFFIANTEKKKNAAKDYASTVSSANARLAPKRFKIVAAAGGANVGRIADYTPDELIEAQARTEKRSAARAATLAKKNPPAQAAPHHSGISAVVAPAWGAPSA